MSVLGMEVTPEMTLLFLALALWSSVGYFVRWVVRQDIAKYDYLNEFFHPAMQVSMGYMFLPLSIQVVSYSVICVLFLVWSLYYLARIVLVLFSNQERLPVFLKQVVSRYKNLASDVNHLFLGLGSAYMFAPMKHILVIDLLFTIFFLWIAVSHIKELVEDSNRTDLTPEGRLAAIISGVLHIVMGVSMAFMNVIMFILV